MGADLTGESSKLSSSKENVDAGLAGAGAKFLVLGRGFGAKSKSDGAAPEMEALWGMGDLSGAGANCCGGEYESKEGRGFGRAAGSGRGAGSAGGS